MILWIVLPHMIYFMLTLLREKPRTTGLDRGIYLWLPILSMGLGVLAYGVASISNDWGIAGAYIPFFLGLLGGVSLLSGGFFLFLSWGFRQLRGEEHRNG
ncbi:hypothetical protein DK842_11765 [Chromobacterium phragmitis]|nr:hypothetical protein DK842_11765 [Chromobacterium phragmitis]AXE35887.1 hypothetical protein DK843_17200 [Chromobacterium phragmitis]